ncbi:MAG: hypothetical protein K1X75_17885 [Leptospirales bacterium]|nr:hypothetical protein [Leptospirales bacterium]
MDRRRRSATVVNMQASNDPRQIAQTLAARFREMTPIPAQFRRRLPEWSAAGRYTIAAPREIQGLSSFEAKPVRIELLACDDGQPWIEYQGQRFSLQPALLGRGQHNIQLGPIQIIEHPLSVMVGMNCEFNIRIDQPSFPTLDYCNQLYIDALTGNLRELSPAPLMTPAHDLLLSFERGYCLLQPADGDARLWIDHQLEYPGQTIGRLRYQAPIDPEFYAFLCRARTPHFRSGGESKRNFELVQAGQTGGIPVTAENVLFVDEERIYNPRAEFQSDGRDYEFLMHEIVDIIAWLKFIEIARQCRFAGRMTTFFFDHHAQIDAAQYCVDHLELRRFKPPAG